MTLPLYVALEKIDRRLLEAAEDLYAGPWRPRGTIVGAAIGGVLGVVVGVVMEWGPFVIGIPGLILGAIVGTWLISEAFIRVTLPLSLPGIFAGSLLTFIPAVGDYINAELLGNPQSLMIGNVIQARYLRVTDYPTASALSFILMAAILVGVLVYTRLLGTEELTGSAV
jgi:spermidine/putrescine transport system permease protein